MILYHYRYYHIPVENLIFISLGIQYQNPAVIMEDSVIKIINPGNPKLI